MTTKDKFDLARWAVDYARKQGADEASVNLSTDRSIEVEVRAGKLEKLQEAGQQSLNLSVYAGRRFSSHTTNDLRRDALSGFIAEAVAMTKYLAQDPHRQLPDPKYYKGQEKVALDLVDPGYEKIDPAERVRKAKAVEAAALAESDKIISVTAGYSDGFSHFVKVASNGFEGEQASTHFSLSGSVTVKDDRGRPEDYAYGFKRHLREMPEPAAVGKEAAQRALKKIGQHKIASGRYDLIIENRSAGRMLGPVAYATTGRALQQKSSFLDGMLDKQIANELLTITDDPFIPRGAGSRLFDGEGLALKRRKFIDRGVLRTYYIDAYYGRKLGLEPTTGSPSNLVFSLGDKDLEGLIKDTRKGILVTNFIGGNSNGTTGDFSYGIVGFYIEDGAVRHGINEMNVSGNFKQFWMQLAAVGNDPFPYGGWRTPSLRFHDVQFSGL